MNASLSKSHVCGSDNAAWRRRWLARMIERAAAGAGAELMAPPHMLRHACGYTLANKGHDTRAIQGWLGHRSITSTVVYTALAPNRFKTSGGSDWRV
jgi:site-specific recombinase XerD